MNLETGSVIQMPLRTRHVSQTSRDEYLAQQQLILTQRLERLVKQSQPDLATLTALMTDLNQIQQRLAG